MIFSLSINNIIYNINSNNYIQRFISKALESIKKRLLNSNNIDLLDISLLRIAKNKDCLIEIKNRKDTITRAKRTKTKFTKQNFFDFKYIDATI